MKLQPATDRAPTSQTSSAPRRALRRPICPAAFLAVASLMLVGSFYSFARDVSVSGDVTPGGATSPTWNVGGELRVGDTGTGTLQISGTGLVSSSLGRIGFFAGSSGSATVSSGTWANSGNLVVGRSGTGTLLVNGGLVSSSFGRIASFAESFGSATVSSGTWANSNSLSVGTTGTGTLLVNGGLVSNSFGDIGFDAGSSGSVTVTSGTWANSGSLVVAQSGTGTLLVDGGLVSNSAGTIGFYNGSSGSATVTSGTWANSSFLYVGQSGTGTLLIDGGLVSVDGSSTAAASASGIGLITLSGSSGNRGILSTQQLAEGSGSGTVNFNGGILQARTNQSDFISGFEDGDVMINAGGAFIDSNGFDIGISSVLSGTGALTKQGAGTLTLTGTNSYTGGTTINAGTLQIGNGAGNGTLGSGNILNQSALLLNRNNALTLNQVISGSGTVTQTGSGTTTMSGNNSYSGGTTLENGTLLIGHNSALGTGDLTIEDGTLRSAAPRRITNAMVVNGDFSVFPGGTVPTVTAFELDGNMDLAGGNRVITNTMNFNAFEFGQVNFGGVISNGGLTLASDLSHPQPNVVFFRFDGTLANTYTGDTIVGQGVSLALDKSANVTAIAGDITVEQEAVLAINKNEQVADTSNVTLEGNGQLQVGTGTDVTESLASLNDDGSGLGVVDLSANTVGSTLAVNSGSFSGTIIGGAAGGSSLVKSGTGTLALSGSNSYAGDTDINSGTLLVNGTHSGTGSTMVDNGATLGGSGELTGAVIVADGGILAPGTSPGTLSTGDLTLNDASQLDFELDTPNVVGSGVNDLISVTGNLILDGQLNITDLGGFGVGTYRLFSYTGSLTDNGLLFGNVSNVPGLLELAISTATTGQIDLLVSAATAQFWDGTNTTANGVVNGGTGTWDSTMTNWTNSTGVANSSWAGTLPAVFSGSAGVVTIANGFSATTPGLDFQVGGYTLAATGSGQLLLSGTTFINTATGETTISAPLNGSGGIVKQGGGDLILSGTNTYSGATAITDGRLRAGSDGALSSASAFTVNNGATLRLDGSTQTIGSLAGDGVVRLNQMGSLSTGADDSNTEFSGRIRGNGDLTKIGSGVQILTGSNDYSGLTTVNGGVLRVRNGGEISGSSGVLLGEKAADDGTLTVNGNGGGATVSTSDGLIVGDAGRGLLRINNGGEVFATGLGLLTVGRDAGSDGTVRVTDTGSLLDLSGMMIVGDAGNGILRVLNGGEVRADSMILAGRDNGSGKLRISGASSLLDIEEDMLVGYLGTASVRIEDGGRMENEGLALLGAVDAGSVGEVTVTGSNSSWRSGDDLVVGAGGKGTLDILNGGSVESEYGAFVGGLGADADGTVTVSGQDSTWTVAEFLSVGGEGSGGILNILEGGQVTAAFSDIGSYPDDMGTLNVDGAGSIFKLTDEKLIIGYEGIGVLNLSNGGLLDQSGVAEVVVLGRDAGSEGTLNIGADPLLSGAAVGAGVIDAIAVRGRNGDATLNFNHTGTDYYFTNNGMASGSAVDIRGTAKVGHFAGTTTLTSRNNYSGGTTIEGGTLRTTHRRALGTGPVTLNGGSLDPMDRLNTGTFTWNGGTVLSDLGSTTDFINVDGDLLLTGPGTFEFAAGTGFSNNQEFRVFNADNMAGFDPLTDFVGNALFGLDPVFSIDGDNLFVNYLGSVIVAGTLLQNSAPVGTPTFADFTVTGPGTTGSPTESNTINSLNFNPGTSLFVFNTLTVTSGRFTVNGGTGTLNGGTLVTPGDFSKEGPGTLIANSDVNVGGVALLQDGALYVNGRFTTGGGLTVFQNALLGGSGVINGNVANNGTVNPGNSPGTLTINGNYSQSSSGTLQIEIASASVFDRLIVSGNAALAGTLQAMNYGGNSLKYGQQFAFLRAGSISGDFDRILMPDPSRFRGRFLTDGGTGTLLVAPTSYTLVAETTNQRNVAKALDSYIPERGNDRETVSIALDLQSEDQYPAAFDAISPAFYESLAEITIDQAVAQNQMLAQRMSAVRLGVGGFSAVGIESPLRYDKDGKSVMEPKSAIQPESAIPNPRWSTWVQGNGIFAKMVSASQVPNYRFQSGGFLVGADYRWSENFSTGLYTGYEYTWADYNGGGNTQINSALFGGYATYDNGGFYADAIIGGGYNGYWVRRPIAFSTVDRTARSTPNGGQFSSYLDLGYDWKVAGFTFGPLVSAQYTYVGIAPFTEDGADSLDLRVDQQNANSIRTNLGARIAYTWNVNENVTIIPELRGFWQHEFLENPRNIGAALDGGNGPSFGYETSTPDRDSIFAGVGLSAQFGEHWSASFYYNANFASQDYLSHAISASLEWKF